MVNAPRTDEQSQAEITSITFGQEDTQMDMMKPKKCANA
jgi:hypothetical protein